MTIDPPVNPNSTSEWVDEAYAKRLWGQLLRRADAVPPTCRRSLLTVRMHANEIWQGRSKGGGRDWFVTLLVPAANGALDFVAVEYDRNGRFRYESPLLRISQHAGQRLFERLRTNSVEDVLATLRLSVMAFVQSDAVNATEGSTAEVALPHGTLHVVAADAGLWVAKTFIPAKPE